MTAWTGWRIGRTARMLIPRRPRRRWRRRSVSCAGLIRGGVQRRIAFELGRHGCPGPVPSRTTMLPGAGPPRPGRPGAAAAPAGGLPALATGRPMELWQLDIVGGIRLADGGEAKVVTGVDDHSRFCVIAAVVRRATGRAVCSAFADALRGSGSRRRCSPTTASSSPAGSTSPARPRCCSSGSAGRTASSPATPSPARPTTTGKVERFHQTLQRELLDDVDVWPDIETAQAAIDAFRLEYNTNRPHQSLDMAFPADRFTARPADERLPLRLPATLTAPRAEPPLRRRQRRAAGQPTLPAPLVVSANGVDPVNLAVEIDPDRARLGEPDRLRAAVLARPRPRRPHHHPLGRHHRRAPAPATASGSRPCRPG